MLTNTVNVLRLYYHPIAGWCFDDERVGLVAEPFVSGMPEIIEAVLEDQGLAGAKEFKLTFSNVAFPDSTHALTWKGEESGGHWYVCGGRSGWLCPAMFHYFDGAPDSIHFRIDPITKD